MTYRHVEVWHAGRTAARTFSTDVPLDRLRAELDGAVEEGVVVRYVVYSVRANSMLALVVARGGRAGGTLKS